MPSLSGESAARPNQQRYFEMNLNVVAKTPIEGTDRPSDESQISRSDEQELAVVQLLKDQFGDYSDPQAYDWSWRETD